jgi:hypothetical protein
MACDDCKRAHTAWGDVLTRSGRLSALLSKALVYVSMARMNGSIGADDLLHEILAEGIEKPRKITVRK